VLREQQTTKQNNPKTNNSKPKNQKKKGIGTKNRHKTTAVE
jgi:hypothetical protein